MLHLSKNSTLLKCWMDKAYFVDYAIVESALSAFKYVEYTKLYENSLPSNGKGERDAL